MIKINFSLAIAVFLSLSLFLVFILWIFYNFRRTYIGNETKYLQQCPYCTYIFFQYGPGQPGKEPGGDQMIACPRCQSYLKTQTKDQE
jgi:uncharacterized paraquat-inducible protein A